MSKRKTKPEPCFVAVSGSGKIFVSTATVMKGRSRARAEEIAWFIAEPFTIERAVIVLAPLPEAPPPKPSPKRRKG